VDLQKRGVWQAGAVSDAEPTGSAATALSYALVLVLAFLLAVWGAFLVPLRWGSVLLPVAVLIAVVGNFVLGRAGGRLLGRAGALGPGLVWLTVALIAGSRRDEGDLIVPGTLPGLAFLMLGAVSAAVAYGAAPRARG
jgi:hypothetical protein